MTGYSLKKPTDRVAESNCKASKKGKGLTGKERAEIGAAEAGNRGVKATHGGPKATKGGPKATHGTRGSGVGCIGISFRV